MDKYKNVTGVNKRILEGCNTEWTITRTFLDGQPLSEILEILFQNRVDNIIYQIHEYKQANSVTSPTVQTERSDMS